MLDRTIPFYNIILKSNDSVIPEAVLPSGYSFRMYTDADEREWARLEYEIGDFDSVEAAEKYFRNTYLSPSSDIHNRCVFAIDSFGHFVGSCIAWRDRRGNGSVASLHWLVVSPDHQGIGIGKALCRKVLQIFARNNEFPVYIHTQPWSYRAILLYLHNGFWIQRSDTFSHYDNQYTQAMGVLKDILPEDQYRELEEHTDTFLPRCKWANPGNPLYLDYHDNEWGVPCHDERQLYELFLLESFQAGLSWETILNKRENFRTAYDFFDINKVCAYDQEKITLLMNDRGIVRNRRKIEASIRNSRIFREIQKEYGSWDTYIWDFTEGKILYENDPAITTSPLSDRISNELKKRRMSFVGSTIIYSYLQAIGVINAHSDECWKHVKQETQ